MNFKNLSEEEIKKLLEESGNGEITINSFDDDDFIFQIPEDYKMTPEQEKEENAFRAKLLEMMSKEKEEVTASYFDNEYGDDNEEDSEDYSLIDEIPFRPKMPLSNDQKIKSALKDKIAIAETRGVGFIRKLTPLNFMTWFLDGSEDEIFWKNQTIKLNKEFLIKEITEKDKSEFPLDIKLLFDECLEYLKQLP